MTNIQTGVACLLSRHHPVLTEPVSLLQRVCCLQSEHFAQETKSHSPTRYFPKDLYCVFQRVVAELTSWVAIKCLDFYLWLNRLGFLITSVHFHGNAGMYPDADSLQRAQNPLQRWRMQRPKLPRPEEREWRE